MEASGTRARVVGIGPVVWVGGEGSAGEVRIL